MSTNTWDPGIRIDSWWVRNPTIDQALNPSSRALDPAFGPCLDTEAVPRMCLPECSRMQRHLGIERRRTPKKVAAKTPDAPLHGGDLMVGQIHNEYWLARVHRAATSNLKDTGKVLDLGILV